MQQSTAIKLIKKYLEVLDNNNFPYEDVYFFGSRLRGDHHKESDIDVCLVSNEYSDKKLSQMSNKASKLKEKVSSYIEPHLIGKNDFGKWHPLGGQVLKEGVKIKSNSHLFKKDYGDNTSRDKYTKFQIDESELDFDTFKVLSGVNKYNYSHICFGKLAIEKILKALIALRTNNYPEHKKDLTQLVKDLSLSDISKEDHLLLSELNKFNIFNGDMEVERNFSIKTTKESSEIFYIRIVTLYEKIRNKLI
ncbi:MAG: nucleotidyltransferase domain-containing protein [bacterium]